MALNNMGLGFVFTAKDLASGTVDRLRRKVKGLSGDTKGAGAAMKKGFTVAAAGILPLAVGIGGLAASKGLADAAGTFQQGLAGVGAITKATTEELELLRQTAKRAGIDTQFDPTEAVDGLNSLASAGQNATQATETLIPVLDLAAGSGGQLGVAQSAEAVVGTLNAYSMAADQATNVTDKLLRTTQLSNFQARDFEAGLAKAAAAGSTFGQSLDDVLITMGQLRNANIDASSASTAFREATRRLGSDAQVQKRLQKEGVKVFDEQTGAMRSVIDIMQDMGSATADMTDKQRNNFVANALGARGLLAFNAIQKATASTTVNGVKQTLKGAAAVRFLRKELAESEGTAAGFREALLNTFEGQKTLLSGTLSTFAISLGEPFARIFKPVVEAVVNGLNFLLESFEAMPDGLKDAIAGVFLFASAIGTLGGAFLIFKGVMIALAPVLAVIKAQFLAMATAAFPVIAAIALVTAAVVGFSLAIKHNVGGLGDFFQPVFDKIKLAFTALKQFFLKGEISGPIVGDLMKAENKGVFKFVEGVAVQINRAKKFFGGFVEGVKAGFVGLRPFFTALKVAFVQLGSALGFIGDTADDAGDRLPVQDFEELGRIIGTVMTFGIGIVTTFAAIAIRHITGVVETFRTLWRVGGFVFDAIKIVAVHAFSAVLNNFDRFLNMIDTFIVKAAGIAATIPVQLRPSGIDSLVQAGEAASERIANRTSAIADRNTIADATVNEIRAEQERTSAADQARREQTAAIVKALESAASGAEKPIEVHLDGEKIAEATAHAKRKEDARGFTNAPSGSAV